MQVCCRSSLQPPRVGFSTRSVAAVLKQDRTFQYGYLPSEVAVERRELDFHAKVRREPRYQYPVAISLGCHVLGVCLPHPEMRGWETQQCAVEGRLGCAMPKINKHLIAQLRTWSLLLARKLVSPVSGSYFANDWTKDIDHWLSQTHYPNSRKIQLRARATALYSDMGSESGFVKSNYRATGFVKDESYTEYKIRGVSILRVMI